MDTITTHIPWIILITVEFIKYCVECRPYSSPPERCGLEKDRLAKQDKLLTATKVITVTVSSVTLWAESGPGPALPRKERLQGGDHQGGQQAAEGGHPMSRFNICQGLKHTLSSSEIFSLYSEIFQPVKKLINNSNYEDCNVYIDKSDHSCNGPETNCWPWAHCYNRKSCFSWYLRDQTTRTPKIFLTCQIYLVTQGEQDNNCQICTKHARMYHYCEIRREIMGFPKRKMRQQPPKAC